VPDLPEVLAITQRTAPLDATVRPPGSKSLTNRALLCAALAPGRSRLTGALFADDTRAMLDAVAALGATVEADPTGATVTVTGLDPRLSAADVTIDARNSGTTSRFVLPAAALRPGRTVIDGSAQLRARPFGPVLDALRTIGAQVEEAGEPGLLPVTVRGPARGGPVRVSGHVSSQFLSGLLMAGPLLPEGLAVELTSPLVSVPYAEMTMAVMAVFGGEAEWLSAERLTVLPGGYRATDFAIEPDASAASYFLGAAAVAGGRVTVRGLGTGSLQGDVAFADVLERMGARVDRSADELTVSAAGPLRGIDIDMSNISDTAQTLAAVAVFAETPTRVRGIGFIRKKETDRIAAVVTELRRAGINATEDEDGFTINPGPPQPTRFATYDDHRMAMSLALLGLRAPGVQISNPACVSKTYPNYFTDLASL
jgi:3-phosphoshikimate 1-carboxyvinyltransferase